MDFCPIARGPCQGRAKCRLWIRGRITHTDTKLLASQLAQYTLRYSSPERENPEISAEVTSSFWNEQGLNNIGRERLIDRYLNAKVEEVEALANQWLSSPGFIEVFLKEPRTETSVGEGPHKRQNTSPP